MTALRMANMNDFGGIMDNQDWERQDQIHEQLRVRQELKIKDNTIKDLQTTNLFLSKQVDNLLAENHEMSRALERHSVAPIEQLANNPVIQKKLYELRAMTLEFEKEVQAIRDSLKSSR